MLPPSEPLVNYAVAHIAPRRRFYRFVFRVARARRRLALATAVRLEPLRPARPPAAFMFRRRLQPLLGPGRVGRANPVAAPILRRGIHHAGDMTARAEHERLVVAAEQVERPVGGAPRHDVVL